MILFAFVALCPTGCSRSVPEADRTVATRVLAEHVTAAVQPRPHLLVHLASHAPLVCAVHSGGKSLHGWFNVEGEDEEKTRRFFRYAVSRGADPATWTRSQFVRMPRGTRDNGKVQAVCYLNPRLAAKRLNG